MIGNRIIFQKIIKLEIIVMILTKCHELKIFLDFPIEICFIQARIGSDITSIYAPKI